MRVTNKDRHRYSRIEAPDAATVRQALRAYLGVLDLTTGQFAERVQRGESTVNLFVQDRYRTDGCGDSLIRKQIWDYLQRNPIIAEGGALPETTGRLFRTKNFQIISEYLASSCDEGDVCLLYGPPGTQKTFVLSHMIAERNREKRNPALYVYATVDMTPRALLKASGAKPECSQTSPVSSGSSLASSPTSAREIDRPRSWWMRRSTWRFLHWKFFASCTTARAAAWSWRAATIYMRIFCAGARISNSGSRGSITRTHCPDCLRMKCAKSLRAS